MKTGQVIVVADDDRDLRWAITLRLNSVGYEVHAVEDGESALRLVREVHPDALILDVRMPGLGGLEVLRMLQTPPTDELPVVMVSASVVDEGLALDAGAACFLCKPYRGDDLLQAVAAALVNRFEDERGPSWIAEKCC